MHKLLLVLSMTLAMQAQTIHVDAQALPNGNGSAQAPFNNIPAAVAYANTLKGSPNIHVAPGRYVIANTLLIEKGLTLQGSDELEIDTEGWPTGELVDPAQETRIVGMATLAGRPMISAGKSGQVINNVKFRGFTFEAAPINSSILDFARVQDFEVRNCIMIGSLIGSSDLAGAINTFASSGTIRDNYMTRLLGAAFMGAGYAGSPADVTFRGNRGVHNREGILLLGTSDGITEPGDHLNATVRDNDLSDNNNQRNSAGIRILVKGRETLGFGYGSTGLSEGNIQATIQHNRLARNKIGIVIDAGFVSRLVPAPPPNVCDTRTFTGLLDLSFRENTVTDSTLRSALVTFTQFQAALSLLEGTPLQFATMQYLHIASFRIDDPDNVLAGWFLNHPATDPFLGGPCGADTIHEQLNNTLYVNGSLVPPTP